MNLSSRSLVLAIPLVALFVWQQSAAAPNLDRGRALYENHCLECHESKVHIRNRTKVRSLADLRAQVSRWSVEVGLKWSFDEIDDVMSYLNSRYYHYAPQD